MPIRFIIVLQLLCFCTSVHTETTRTWRYTNKEHSFYLDAHWRYKNVKPNNYVTSSNKNSSHDESSPKANKKNNFKKSVEQITKLIRGDGKAGCFIARYDLNRSSRGYSASIRKVTELMFRSIKNNDYKIFHPGLPHMGEILIESNLAEKHPTWEGWRMDFIAKPSEQKLPVISKRMLAFIEYKKNEELRQLLQFFCIAYGKDDEYMEETINKEFQPMLESLTFDPSLIKASEPITADQ